jgi:hypothetical protein
MKTKIQTLIIVIALGAGCGVFPVRFAAASQESARSNAYLLFTALQAAGWEVRTLYNGALLRRGESILFKTTLVEGYTYQIAAAGCRDAYDVDLRVFDENGNLIERDADSSNVAVVTVTPRWTGKFQIIVTLYNSKYNGAHVFVEYAYSNG